MRFFIVFLFLFLSYFLPLKANYSFAQNRINDFNTIRQIPYPEPKKTAIQEILYKKIGTAIKKDTPLPEKNTLKNDPLHILQQSQQTLKNDIALQKLKEGLEALKKGNIAKIQEIRNDWLSDSLNKDILTWSLVLSNHQDIPLSEYEYALEHLKNWPARKTIKSNRELAFIRETKNDQKILAFFQQNPPLTPKGIIAFIDALYRNGKKKEAQKIAIPFWINARLSSQEEKDFLKVAAPLLTQQDQFKRLETLLLRRHFIEAQRTAHYANALNFYRVIHDALRRSSTSNLARLNRLEKEWGQTATFQFAKINLLRRLEKYNEAAILMLKSPKSSKDLIVPDSWCVERNVLSRELLDLGHAQMAYQLIAPYNAHSISLAITSEFHAGWYALRFLNNPALASKHFQTILRLSKKTSNKALAYYWLGRTEEALGHLDKAKSYFQISSHYGTYFYGQLSAAHLNKKAPELYIITPNAKDIANFLQKEPIQAIKRLETVGSYQTATLLYRQLGRELTNPTDIAILVDMAQKQQGYFLGLKISKDAAARNIDIGALTHPIGAIPLPKTITSPEKALIYAIARQESEFNPNAYSPAGARGMLQMMPSTARKVAHENQLYYSTRKLIHDPAYNSLLGLYFLRDQLKTFDFSFILTFAAYNAGSSRVRSWIERYGDPRTLPLNNIIDWIERIPYPETRNYVMRIMENYEIYKTRFTGESNIEYDLRHAQKVTQP